MNINFIINLNKKNNWKCFSVTNAGLSSSLLTMIISMLGLMRQINNIYSNIYIDNSASVWIFFEDIWFKTSLEAHLSLFFKKNSYLGKAENIHRRWTFWKIFDSNLLLINHAKSNSIVSFVQIKFIIEKLRKREYLSVCLNSHVVNYNYL